MAECEGCIAQRRAHSCVVSEISSEVQKVVTNDKSAAKFTQGTLICNW
jgi:hypothetical protein